MAKHTAHADFPYDVERGDAGDALALRESMRRDLENSRGVHVREAVELGATWREVVDALDIDPDNGP
ncbi:hypothetical protein [Streptomyces venetus]|uniref:hypothetical protein n=1 Tax=Streptomyces venetus TaxID=1701086 RepID=UPI003C2DAF14